MKQRTLNNFFSMGNIATLAILVAGVMTTPAEADSLIIDPATVSGPPGDDSPTLLIDNSSLSSDLASPGTTEALPVSFPDANVPANSFSGEYRFNPPTALNATPLVFNLNLDPGSGGNATGYDISGLYVYNYEESYDDVYYNNRGLETTTLEYSTNGGASYQTYGTLTFSEAPESGTNPGEEITLDSTLSGVTNLEFTGGSNYGEGSYTGLNEVRFIGTVATTPEPSTYGMVFVGLGALAVLVSHRRRRGELVP